MNDPMRSTQESVMPAMVGINAYDYGAADTPSACPATRAIMVNVGATYKLYFTDAPSTAITMILATGLVYPFSIVKIAESDGTLVATGAITLLY